MAPRALLWIAIAVLLAPGVLASRPPPFFAAEGEATFTLVRPAGACSTPATATFVWESTALPDDPNENAFHAVSPPELGCFSGQVTAGFSDGACERYQDVGIRCAGDEGTTSFLLADDGAFHFHKEYPELADVVYVNGTMGGIMPCHREGDEYTYAPCPGTATRGLPDL